MSSEEKKKNQIIKLMFICVCVITLAVLAVDIILFFENVQLEKNIQKLIESFEKLK